MGYYFVKMPQRAGPVEAAKLCDHVALLNDGQIVEYGTPQELCLRYNRDKRYRILLENGEGLNSPWMRIVKNTRLC